MYKLTMFSRLKLGVLFEFSTILEGICNSLILTGKTVDLCLQPFRKSENYVTIELFTISIGVVQDSNLFKFISIEF